jgi:hypothetical protein
MNTLTIYPSLLGTTGVFDGSRTGLKEEAFVLGMSEMSSRLVEVTHHGQTMRRRGRRWLSRR